MFNKKQKEIDRLEKICKEISGENEQAWVRCNRTKSELAESMRQLDIANADISRANEQIESGKKELAKWKEWAEAIEKYYSTATITDHHELKKITKKGKIKWLPYADNGNGTIEIYGETYDKAVFGKFEDRVIREITYSGDKPYEPGTLGFHLKIGMPDIIAGAMH